MGTDRSFSHLGWLSVFFLQERKSNVGSLYINRVYRLVCSIDADLSVIG